MNVFSDFIFKPSNWNANGLFDSFGITDSKAGERGLETLNQGMQQAFQNADTQMQPVFDMYQGAMGGHDLGTAVDDFNKNMGAELGALDWNNIQGYVNPQYGQQMRSATESALGGAGSSMQSSAANNAVARGVANQSAQLYDQAFKQALADSENNQGIYKQQFETTTMPSLNWAQLQSDLAGAKLDAATAQANAAAQTAGQNRGFFSSLGL